MSSSGMNGIPGANAMGDTLEFVKNLWGSMKIPGMAMPSMSPEEIDKQIADLKAVESWLQMNMNMLRGSIQALEVQSATLSALRSMSETFSQAASGATPADDKPSFESPFTSAKPRETEASEADAKADPAGMAAPFANPAVWWNAVQDQFQQAVSQAVAPAKKPARKTGTTKKKPAASAGSKGGTSSSGTRRRKPGEST
jgi:hypothetical protein